MQNEKILQAWRLLYYSYGIVAIVAGLDKYFHFIVNWNQYLNPVIPAFFHMTDTTFMYVVGVIEIIAGILVFVQPIIGGYLVAAWLLLIVANLISLGAYYDIAIRDVVMAIGAYVLVLLTKAIQENPNSRR